MMRFVVIVCFAIAAQTAAFAAPVTASGPTALALAAVLAQQSPQIPPFNKRVIARLFHGNTNFGFVPNTKISVDADSVVCTTSNVARLRADICTRQALLDGSAGKRDQRNGARRRRDLRGRRGLDRRKPFEAGLYARPERDHEEGWRRRAVHVRNGQVIKASHGSLISATAFDKVSDLSLSCGCSW